MGFPKCEGRVMKREEAVKYLDQLQDCLLRAETARKDIDLIVALRVCYELLETYVKSLPVPLPDFK